MTDEELLDSLEGSWRVTGELRGTALSQLITARRVLAGKFVELNVTGGTPLIDGRPYEAVYFIGASGEGHFVMNLVDVLGAEYSAVPGVGRRELDDIVFTFAYADGPWTWRWSPTNGGWDLTQSYVDAGAERLFAIKRMDRIS
jgi:hypothetical protein